jgi:uncharacterized protein with HEPN domain
MVEFASYKSIFASKTFWGALIAMLGVVIPKFAGFDLNTVWPVLTVVLGSILAIIGRFTAKKETTLTGQPPTS